MSWIVMTNGTVVTVLCPSEDVAEGQSFEATLAERLAKRLEKRDRFCGEVAELANRIRASLIRDGATEINGVIDTLELAAMTLEAK